LYIFSVRFFYTPYAWRIDSFAKRIGGDRARMKRARAMRTMPL
jgi:hypothetical protein